MLRFVAAIGRRRSGVSYWGIVRGAGKAENVGRHEIENLFMLTSDAPVGRIITKGRSATSNGARLWPRTIDGRHTSARRLRDLVQSYAAMIGVTVEQLTEAERSLVLSAANLTIKAEQLRAKAATGQEVGEDSLVRVSNAQVRALKALRRLSEPPGSARRPTTKPRKSPPPPPSGEAVTSIVKRHHRNGGKP
jgi:hypothetical protein